MQSEQWLLGTATAAVTRDAQAVEVRLRGVVTAMVVEALHMRLALEPAALRRTLILDACVLLPITSLSIVEAALRGTPRSASGLAHIALGVPLWRLGWAVQLCVIMSLHGLSRSAFLLAAEPGCEVQQLVLPLAPAEEVPRAL